MSDLIEVDPAILANGEEDTYASSGIETDTTSLTSSIYEYVFEGGRRYHAYYGKDRNPLPTDEKEQDRMDIHHEVITALYNGNLHKSPITSPTRILDVGTGTGIWAIEAAEKYPSAKVIGLDLSPIQPAWIPPNLIFQLDDIESPGWTFPPSHFSLTHLRNVSQAIVSWPKLLANLYNSTIPGGYVELAETGGTLFSDDNTMPASSPLKKFFDLITLALEKMGRPTPTKELLRSRLEDAGFVDVVVTTVKQPLGPWPKDKRLKHIGAMVMLTLETGFHAYGMVVFTRVLGMSHDEADKICSDAYTESRNKNTHTYTLFYNAYGRKPE